jgi:pimeloyl-ACP methyl ester carboxylesterase
MNAINSTLLATLLLTACTAEKDSPAMPSTTTATAPKTTAAVTSGRVAVNGIDYYYELHGRGEPLLLLHGGLGTLDMFGATLDQLAASHTVIAVEIQGHGRTTLGDRKFDLADMGDDMSAIVKHLGYAQVDAMGYSLGAGIAFRFAVQHPAQVRKLVLVSAGFSSDGFYPEMRPMQGQLTGAMAPMMKDTPMYKSYVAVAPHPEQFPQLLDRIGELMRGSYNYRDDVKKLTMPTMLVCGDSDMFSLDHIVEFYHLLGGGLRDAGWQREHMSKNRLAILPNQTHYDMAVAPALAPTALGFLDGTTPPVWTAPVASTK